MGGEYQTISIPAGLFAQLRDYGWAITYRTSSHARSIFVGDVYLSVTTSETDYTLTYNANGGSGAPGRQTGTGVGSHTFTISGTKPTRAGHTFLGWSLSSTATSASYQPGGSITLTASATLYAVWRINTYTVSYNANGGSGAPASQTKTYGAPLTLSAAKPTRAGHTFLGWNTKADGSGAGYAAGGSYTANAAATLYAQWQANAYAVTFDAQGGNVTPAGKSVTYGQPYGALPVPERPGYRFDGWFTAAARRNAGDGGDGCGRHGGADAVRALDGAVDRARHGRGRRAARGRPVRHGRGRGAARRHRPCKGDGRRVARERIAPRAQAGVDSGALAAL